MTALTIHTDGASRGNPGPSAFAFTIQGDGLSTVEEAGRLPDTTNNQAEYTALVRALEHALKLGADHRLTVHSDSELMVKQMTGQYRVKDAGLRPLYEKAVRLKDQFRHPVKFVHVRREKNGRADELCNEVLDGRRRPPPAPRMAAAEMTLHQRAVWCLNEAAEKWAQGNPNDPSPAAVWRELWSLIQSRGAADDGEE
jgi:ribonuclease HI